MTIDDRDFHLIQRGLAVALDIISRAHPHHQPSSDADDMANLFLRLVPNEAERLVWQHSCKWLLGGGLDLRERELPPMTGGSPTPLNGRERQAA